MEMLGYAAIILMGIVLGLMGGGGSILTVPIMVYFFGYSATAATGNSLFVVGLTALIGSIMYIRKGEIDFKTGFLFAVPSVIGVNVSRGLIIPKIPEIVARFDSFQITKETLIMAAFAAMMVAASYSMIKRKGEQKPLQTAPLLRAFFLVLQGLIVGLIAGFVGAGGGFLIVPALVLLARLSMRVAIGTSLMIIALQSLLGFAGDVARGKLVDWPQMALITSLAILGILLGSTFAHKIKEQILKTAFGWFVLVMGATILLEQFRLSF